MKLFELSITAMMTSLMIFLTLFENSTEPQIDAKMNFSTYDFVVITQKLYLKYISISLED